MQFIYGLSIFDSMKFFRQLYKGMYCYVDGAKFIYQHKLWVYFLAPIALGIGLYFLGEWFLSESQHVKPEGDTMHEIMITLLKSVSLKGMGLMLTETQKYIAVIFLSTVWAILSERVEEIVTGNNYPFVWKYYIADVKRGVRINIWCMIQEYLIFFGWLIFSYIFQFPEEANFIAALLIGFYYYGFGYMDYVNERRRLNITQSVHFTRRNAGLAVGIGIIYSVAFQFIPLGIGILVAPVAMVGTTLVMHELVDLSKNEFAERTEPQAVQQ